MTEVADMIDAAKEEIMDILEKYDLVFCVDNTSSGIPFVYLMKRDDADNALPTYH